MATLVPDEIEPFLVAYNNLLQTAAGNYIESDSDAGKDDEDVNFIEDGDEVRSEVTSETVENFQQESPIKGLD